MIKCRIRGIDFALSLLFPAALVVLFTLDPSGMPLWCVGASVMHEAGHFIMIYALGHKSAAVRIGLFGVCVVQNPQEPVRPLHAVLIALAGPIVNLVTFFVLFATVGFTMPVTVHAVMALFNLLPIEPLDGGQALWHALSAFVSPQLAERIVMIVSVCVLLPLATVGFFILLQSGYNFTLLAVSVYLGLLLLFMKR